jgi:hypothetical protein
LNKPLHGLPDFRTTIRNRSAAGVHSLDARKGSVLDMEDFLREKNPEMTRDKPPHGSAKGDRRFKGGTAASQARRTGIYVMSDDERAAVAKGIAQADRGEFVPDDVFAEADKRYRR